MGTNKSGKSLISLNLQIKSQIGQIANFANLQIKFVVPANKSVLKVIEGLNCIFILMMDVL